MVILHLKPDWSPQSPKNIQQALKDQLTLFLCTHTNKYTWCTVETCWDAVFYGQDMGRVEMGRRNKMKADWQTGTVKNWRYSDISAAKENKQ